MTFSIRVNGGTGAGTKRQKPKPEPWLCYCTPVGKPNPGYLTRCATCKATRPEHG